MKANVIALTIVSASPASFPITTRFVGFAFRSARNSSMPLITSSVIRVKPSPSSVGGTVVYFLETRACGRGDCHSAPQKINLSIQINLCRPPPKMIPFRLDLTHQPDLFTKIGVPLDIFRIGSIVIV
eukprot:CCRYP_014319-RC/>CCRYP_014319-RC protein AED:0.47 eAED:1.00 QI:0/0/0/1/0/0/2/0/126